MAAWRWRRKAMAGERRGDGGVAMAAWRWRRVEGSVVRAGGLHGEGGMVMAV